MTEELAGGAAAPAEVVSTPEVQSNTPTPITESTPRGAIDRAFASLGEESSEPAKPEPAKPTAEPVATEGERERNPDGTFKAKELAQDGQAPVVEGTEPKEQATPAGEPPSRFSADAKAAWKDAPEPVKAEVHRALRELEQGVEKYRGDATVYNEVFKPFVDMAVRSQIDPQVQLTEYVKIDQALAQDFNAGIGMIFRNAGVDPREWAASVMGQQLPPEDQRNASQERVINGLMQEIAALKSGFSGVQQTMAQQRGETVQQTIEGFVTALPETDKALFRELDQDIAARLNEPNATLETAFAAAKQEAQARYQRLFGSPASSAAPAPQPAPDLSAQTRKGSLSITGAPGPGSNPDTRKPPSSPRAALDASFAQLGLG